MLIFIVYHHSHCLGRVCHMFAFAVGRVWVCSYVMAAVRLIPSHVLLKRETKSKFFHVCTLCDHCYLSAFTKYRNLERFLLSVTTNTTTV